MTTSGKIKSLLWLDARVEVLINDKKFPELNEELVNAGKYFKSSSYAALIYRIDSVISEPVINDFYYY